MKVLKSKANIMGADKAINLNVKSAGTISDDNNTPIKVVAKTLKDIPADKARSAFAETGYFVVFLVITCALTLVEPILVGFPTDMNHNAIYNAQIAVLAASTLMFFIGLIALVQYYPEDDNDNNSNNENNKPSLFEKFSDMFDGEVLFELICLTFGWVFLFTYPGIAALRCFRVFRLMWYFELYEEELPEDYNPAKYPFSPMFAAHQCLEYLEKLAVEALTAKSRGALVVLGMFFYVTYITSIVFWTDKSYLQTPESGFENGYTCTTLPICFITLMRLALYDGNGLDYLTAVAQEDQTVYQLGNEVVNGTYYNHTLGTWEYSYYNETVKQSHVHHKGGAKGYATVLVMYMILTAVILLNGLIGIFGEAFVSDTNDSEEEEEEDDEDTVGKAAGDGDGQVARVKKGKQGKGDYIFL